MGGGVEGMGGEGGGGGELYETSIAIKSQTVAMET